MYSEAQSNLWANELLEALSNDAGISQPTKKICAKLKHQQNPWQDELKAKWRRIKYPLYEQSDIVKLNSTWHKHIQAINLQRQNQRDFYMSQGNHQAAAQISTEPDNSMSERACIVKQESKTVGWDPTANEYVLVSTPYAPDLEKLSEFVDQCMHSQATNIPKSISNLMEEGEARGFTEVAYTSLWLQFIKKYLKNSYQPALTYSRNLNELFEFLLSLVDTQTEITKIRTAIAKIVRKQDEPVSFSVLKLKSLTSSLMFMIEPTATLFEVSKRSSRAAIDGLYSLVSDAARVQLTSWKRRCNEMAKNCTLQDHLDAIANIEQVVTCKPSRDYLVPARLADSDIMASAFWTQYGLTKPQNKPQAGKNNEKPERSKSNTPQTSGQSTRSSSWESARGSSTGRRSRASTPGSNHSSESGRSKTSSGHIKSSRDDRSKGQRYRAEEEGRKGRGERARGGKDEKNRGRGGKKEVENSKNSKRKYHDDSNKSGQIMNKNCKKCGSISHFSKNCVRYPFFYDQPCRHCSSKGNTLYHPPDLCRFSQSRYKTPPPRSSPVSFQGNENLSNIFSKN